jgi:hypothetical protein
VIELAGPYETRSVRCLQVSERGGWRMKVYSITYGRDGIDDALVDAALAAGHARLPTPATTADRYGVGFIGVHQGRSLNFVFIDWWAHENELHHHVWFSNDDRPANLRAWRPDDPIACAWDLILIAFERAAWVREVLANPRGPDLDTYLAAQLDDPV